MTDEFPILLVTQEAYEASSNETLGSKYKFWFHHKKLGHCLYKQTRLNLGEDWAEKVASQLCELIGLPHAVYELASTWGGSRGVISPNFLPQGGTLVHGNELLASIFDEGIYQFVYTQGVKEAQKKCAFKPLSSFPRLDLTFRTLNWHRGFLVIYRQ